MQEFLMEEFGVFDLKSILNSLIIEFIENCPEGVCSEQKN